jgi:lipoic acid synthetase
MSSLKNIPVVTETRAPRSGEKYVTPQGFTAIKDGQKPRGAESPSARVGKPRWITAPLAAGAGFSAVKGIVREHRLATVCEEAKCPEHR